jgi:hypothetical protein
MTFERTPWAWGRTLPSTGPRAHRVAHRYRLESQDGIGLAMLLVLVDGSTRLADPAPGGPIWERPVLRATAAAWLREARRLVGDIPAHYALKKETIEW